MEEQIVVAVRVGSFERSLMTASVGSFVDETPIDRVVGSGAD